MRVETILKSTCLFGATLLMFVVGGHAEPQRAQAGGVVVACDYGNEKAEIGCASSGIQHVPIYPRCRLAWFAAPYFPQMRCH